jgi:hypothetical protein
MVRRFSLVFLVALGAVDEILGVRAALLSLSSANDYF